MSASRNPDAVANQGLQFHSRVPPSEPLTTKGHAPGVKVGNDAAPEFIAQTLPPGSAPSDRTFQPNPQSEIPGRALNPDTSDETRIDAQDTLGGATSGDVHTGYGHPGSGQTSKELHASGAYPGKREKNGLAGVGADPMDTYRERGLDQDFPKGTMGKRGVRSDQVPGAEERAD